MQERTINNALIALRKQGGPQGKIAEALLDMREVPLPRYVQDQPFKRGEVARIVLAELKARPKTNTQLGQAIRRIRADLTAKAALKLRGVTYADLADRIGEKEVNIRNKLSRGKFSAAFLLRSFEAIGEMKIRL